MTYDSFNIDLQQSDSPFMEDFFNSFHVTAFKDFVSSDKITDIPTQKLGIDRIIHTETRSVKIEEKFDRYYDRTNVCFEISDRPNNAGWSLRPQHSDIILYTYLVQRKGYYWQTNQLLPWYRENYQQLNTMFRHITTRTGAVIQPIPAQYVAKQVPPLKFIQLERK